MPSLHGVPPALESLDLAHRQATDRGIGYFAFGDFSALTSETLEDTALPWVLVSSLVALLSVDGDVDTIDDSTVADAFRRFGFHSPERLANWPASLPTPSRTSPLGMNVARASRLIPPVAVQIANIGCASCHTGITYTADGLPDTSEVWIGGSNTSINPEAFVNALDAALLRFNDDERLEQTIDRLYPDLSWRERLTLERFVRPAVEKRAATRRASLGRLTPYPLSVPGATNGLDALRHHLDLADPTQRVAISAFNSVPELGGLTLQTNLLNAGSYRIADSDTEREMRIEDVDGTHLHALATLTAFVAVPTMGVTPTVAASHIDKTDDILEWLHSYETQPWPGEIDADLAKAGSAQYAARCAGCHGVYDDNGTHPRLISFPNRADNMATDPLTASLFTEEVAERIEDTVFGQFIDAEVSTHYRAPALDGLWASAPYLHNGSVPTLWHLMYPNLRPERFHVGGHALDMQRVGIAYPAGHSPWSDPVLINTREPGFDNGGHVAVFDTMNGAQKEALLEYLKRL